LYRVFTDDSWDIVSGQSRSTPAGQKNSLSGLGIGFGWFLNQHMWRMAIYDSRLYVGTFDEAVWLRFEKGASVYQNEFGFDLWWTEDGTYFSQVDQQGFGDGYNMGVRTMEPTPYGLFLGTANPFYGLEVFRGINTTPVNLFGSVLSSSGSTAQSDAATPPSPPQHVQVEGGTTGALLSWDAPAGGAQRYRIFRRSYDPIDVKIVGVDSDAHPAYTHGEWEEVGVTDKATYVDTSASQFGQYAYQIKAENEGGLSEYSNFVTYPSAAPPTSFEDAWTAVNKLMVGGKFVDAPTRDAMLKLLAEAQDGAAKGEFAKLRTLWSSVKTAAGAVFSNAKDARDFELALSRLYKRAQLVQAGSLSASALAVSHDATPPIAPNQLNCTATGIGGSLVCTQPTSGLGGSTYTNASVTVNGPYWANNRYTDNDFEYYIYEPGTPAPATAPVILFLHGYNAILPSDYLGWINQMVQNGYIVVWVQYQANLTSTFANYPTNAQAAWTDALYRLENYTWEPHVRPKRVNGVPQTLIVGHSFGGWIAAWLAGAASTSIPSFPIPRGLVLIEPASLGLLPAINFAGIDPGTRMLVLSGDQDTVACSKDGVSIFTSTTQIPAAQKNYLFYNSDNSGTPNQVGNHFFPNTYGYHDTAAIDNRDYYATYKLSVAAANCLTSQTSCGTFLGNGSTSQLYMGTWSNGTAIAPMTYYADPTQLPPITGCQQ
jgi:acetyl esterase/lipase